MPVDSAGTVHSVVPSSQSSVDVGPSSAYPSDEVHSTSSTPWASAHRWEAMLIAYDSVFAPPSSHGARCRASAAYPSDAVATVMPSRRATATEGASAVTVA